MMRFNATTPIPLLLLTTAIVVSAPAAASAQRAAITVPALPLAEALGRIQAASGTRIAYDPDAVRNLMSAPVTDARSAKQAVRLAIRNMHLSLAVGPDGTLSVTSDVLVVAGRDEAETSLLVRRNSTSDRSGAALADQARNTQVISSKLIAEQQDLTVAEALRNAGGVVVNTGTVQGGVSYGVRGFTSAGLLNGLPTPGTVGVTAGVTQPVANIERLEVLKGPEALLAGADNLGGSVNIVTKKPSADPRLMFTVDTGSYGLARLTVDGNAAVTADKHVSVRIIGTDAIADRNYGGYRGDKEELIAPSVRFKNGSTDVVVGMTSSDQRYGEIPYTYLNPSTNQPFARDRSTPLYTKDQGIEISSLQFYADATQKVASWLTLVARAQHQQTTLNLGQYTPLAVISSTGTVLLSNSQSTQRGKTDAVDAYARLTPTTFGITHKLSIGYSYLSGDTRNYYSNSSGVFPFNPLNPGTQVLRSLAPVDTLSYISGAEENGYYAQDLAEYGRLHVFAAVRHTDYSSTVTTFFRGTQVTTQKQGATTPSFGAVVDIIPQVALFGNYAKGFSATFATGYNGAPLPNITSRNEEGGIRLKLFSDRLIVNASYFDLRQDTTLIADPVHAGYSVAAPGLRGRGVDLNLAGTILPGWTAQAAFTHTDYRNLTLTGYADIPQGRPRDQYSLYSSYRRTLSDKVEAGAGAGVYGRSSAVVDPYALYSVPRSLQVDLNGFVNVGPVSANIGVRNLLDRQNYGISYAKSYIPYGEPRSWRLTLGYRF